MSEIIKISNDEISAEISTFGAEFKSIKKNGTEILWGGDPGVWPGQAPIMFPICGGLRDGKFVFEGKEYTLSKHGFAKLSEFEVEKKSSESVTFLLKSNAETLEKYPFEFEFRVTFTLNRNAIEADYAVKNVDTKTMYYFVGAHEAYDCPEGIDNYSVVFEKEENFMCNILGSSGLKREKHAVAEKGIELPLKVEYFSVDALIFTTLNSRKVALKNLNTEKVVVEVDFSDFDSLLLWTKPNGKYICIEPWSAVLDFEDSDMDITKKDGVSELAPRSEYVRRHTLTF